MGAAAACWSGVLFFSSLGDRERERDGARTQKMTKKLSHMDCGDRRGELEKKRVKRPTNQHVPEQPSVADVA